jgi:hypothetical protein
LLFQWPNDNRESHYFDVDDVHFVYYHTNIFDFKRTASSPFLSLITIKSVIDNLARFFAYADDAYSADFAT